jgi:hypothetical protein
MLEEFPLSMRICKSEKHPRGLETIPAAGPGSFEHPCPVGASPAPQTAPPLNARLGDHKPRHNLVGL